MSNTPDILVTAAPGAMLGRLHFNGHEFTCVLGRSGIVAAKREGDGGTPVGTFPLRELRYRPDRLSPPQSLLAEIPSASDDGWCDAPDDPAYNRFVKRPYAASTETLWRDDHLYDIAIMLGYNDAPVMAGAGSAIFFHLAKDRDGGLQPTEGCVALRLEDMRAVLKTVTPTTRMMIRFKS
ncbi:MAG TPA: L,D-transpeptidase family protein [Parvibaculum sp.]|jgi:L,D-peptidoglycan transpeptidase YkuD (ErfK/YbiS/YcfS/YnhG family)